MDSDPADAAAPVTDPSDSGPSESPPSPASRDASDGSGHEDPSILTFDLELFGGMTQEEWESANDELRRGCGWG